MSQPLNDVSPWPQADRVNPTRGELAESLRGPLTARLHRNDPPKPNAVKDLHSNTYFERSSKKGTILSTVPAPSALLGYAVVAFGQLQILDFANVGNARER